MSLVKACGATVMFVHCVCFSLRSGHHYQGECVSLGFPCNLISDTVNRKCPYRGNPICSVHTEGLYYYRHNYNMVLFLRAFSNFAHFIAGPVVVLYNYIAIVCSYSCKMAVSFLSFHLMLGFSGPGFLCESDETCPGHI